MTLRTDISDITNPTTAEAALQYVQSFGADLTYEQVKEIAVGFEAMVQRERNIQSLNVMRSTAVWLNDLGQTTLANQLAEQSARFAEKTGLQAY